MEPEKESSTLPTPQEINDNPFKSFQIQCKIGQSKFPVYLINSKVDNNDYVMKLFPYIDE